MTVPVDSLELHVSDSHSQRQRHQHGAIHIYLKKTFEVGQAIFQVRYRRRNEYRILDTTCTNPVLLLSPFTWWFQVLVVGAGHQGAMKLLDQIQGQIQRAATTADRSQAIIQCPDIAQRYQSIVRKPLIGARHLVFEQLRQIGLGTLDLAAEDSLTTLQATGDEVGMGKQPCNRCGACDGPFSGNQWL